MGKMVKRLILDDIYAIGRNESWFSDMANKGLHLKKFGRFFIYFEKGEERETKYRIDYLKVAPSQEQIDVYHECGWDFVTNQGNFYVFSADVESATELHTDPIEQGFTLADLNKRLKLNLIFISAMMLLFFGMMFSIYYFNDEPYLYMVKGQFAQQMLLVIVELYVFYSVIRNYVTIRNLKKSLLQGNALNHQENYKKTRLIGGILAGIFLPISLFAIFIPFAEIAKREDYTLTEGDATHLPIIRLANIEQNPKLEREARYRNNNVDWANRVSYDWSLLSPVQYEIVEHGLIKGEMWGDQSGEYSPSINTQYYKLTFAGMAENLTLDLINRNVYRDDIDIKEVNNSVFDKMYIADEEVRKQVFAYSGNQVIHVTYYGQKDIGDIVRLISLLD